MNGKNWTRRQILKGGTGVAISLPFLQDERMPLGLQIIGRADEDAQLMACAHWLWQNY